MPKTGTKLAERFGVDVTKDSPTPPKPEPQGDRKRPPGDTAVSQHHDTVVETIRARVKEIGKEAATYRFTPAEKKLLREALRRFEDAGIRTSENVIARISINKILLTEKPFLEEVVKALHK